MNVIYVILTLLVGVALVALGEKVITLGVIILVVAPLVILIGRPKPKSEPWKYP